MGKLSWADIYQSGGSVYAVIAKVLRGEGTIEEEEFVGSHVDPSTRLAVALMAVADARNVEKVLAPQVFVDDASRCAVCGYPLSMDSGRGCVRGKCSMMPQPTKLYSPARALREAEIGMLRPTIITPELAAAKGIPVGAQCIFCHKPYTGEVGFDDHCTENPCTNLPPGYRVCCYMTGWRKIDGATGKI